MLGDHFWPCDRRSLPYFCRLGPGFQHLNPPNQPRLAFNALRGDLTQRADFSTQRLSTAPRPDRNDKSSDGHDEHRAADDHKKENDFVHKMSQSLSIGRQGKLIFPRGIIDKPYSLSLT